MSRSARPFDFDEEELARVACEAYLYFYPLVIMDVTRRVSTNFTWDPNTPRGPMNTLNHLRAFPPGEFRTIVRPNFDTLYSTSWVDVRDEPWIFSVPALPEGRFVMLPCYDMWTEVFASPGTRTNGTGPFEFALCAPSWRGSLPTGVERINTPTPYVWVLGRTETDGPGDYPYVHAFQDGIQLRPLSRYPQPALAATTDIDETVDMRTPPMIQVQALNAREFFARAAELIALHPAHHSDWNMLARLRHLGFVVGDPYNLDEQPATVRLALETAPEVARARIISRFVGQQQAVNGWSIQHETMAVWGNAYLKRAAIAMWGIGANPPEESLYPTCAVDRYGEVLSGAHQYRIHFPAGSLPPVRAFWSLTAYDLQGYTVPNGTNRYAIGDLGDLRYNLDGSLDLYLQHSAVSDEWASNWLPVPEDRFILTMRLYLPEESVFDRAWSPPAVEPVD